MKALRFIGKSCAMYAIGMFLIDFPIWCLTHRKEKKVEQNTNMCGFEAERRWRNPRQRFHKVTTGPARAK